jgi:hypothetical protein
MEADEGRRGLIFSKRCNQLLPVGVAPFGGDSQERIIMCDYSLHAVATRPARVGEKLVSMRFLHTTTRGFADEKDPQVAVCLRPGTEIAFDKDVRSDGFLFRRKVGARLARFRQIDTDKVYQHHDALEFSNGKIVLLTDLVAGQTATVLQLPVSASAQPAEPEPARPNIVAITL